MAKITAAPTPASAPAKAPNEPTPIKQKRSKLPIFAGIGLLLAFAGAGAAWHLMRGGDAAKDGASSEQAAPASKPIFVTLEPFTVNLAEENGDHYLQIGLVYQVRDDKIGDAIKLHMPILRNRLLLLLSGKRPSDLTNADGKKKLVEELVIAARESLPGTTADKGVTSALLGSFVIQ